MDTERLVQIGVTVGAAVAGLLSTFFSHRAVKTVNRETSSESGTLKTIVVENAERFKTFAEETIRDRKDVRDRVVEATIESRVSRNELKEDITEVKKDVKDVVQRVGKVEKDVREVKDKVMKSKVK